MYSRIHT
jgi:ATP-binding cassette subfamily A (ABC1) protein 3